MLAHQAPTLSEDQAEAWDRAALLLREAGVDLDDDLLTPPASDRQSTLAITGKAGSGKTLLLATLTRALRDAGVERIVVLPLYPQYSVTTTATSYKHLLGCLRQLEYRPELEFIGYYPDHPAYIDALAQSVERNLSGLEQQPDVLVCSYHGLPQRYLMEGDPYHCQCQKTTRLLKERLGWSDERIVTTFQSQFGPEDWLRPYTVDHVADLARDGKKRIAVISPAFSADCIETLEEINEEIRESFEEAGGEVFTYVPCLNDDAAHISVLSDVISENLRGWLG